MSAIIKANILIKNYKDYSLNISNFELPNTGLIGLIGNNGAGKTTLLKLLSGRIEANAFDGTILGQVKPFQNLQIGEDCVFFSSETKFVGKLKRIIEDFDFLYPKFDYDKCKKLIDTFKLPLNKAYKALSQGMKAQFRLSLLYGIPAKILFLDEETNGLDVSAREIIYSCLQELCKSRLIVFSTHILDQDKDYFDRAIIINEGKILYDCSRNQTIIEGDGENYKIIDKSELLSTDKEVDIIYLYRYLCKKNIKGVLNG